MAILGEKRHRCRLFGNYYSDSDMSEENYPIQIQKMKMLLLLMASYND